MKRQLSRILVLSALLLLVSCSTSKPLSEPKPYFSAPVILDDRNQAEMSWWAYRYLISWPKEVERPDFAVDLLLAHKIVKPVLEKYSSRLSWWRFHRRASRKAPGHQFSFLFYTDQKTAKELIRELDISPVLQELKQAGLIKKIVKSNTDELLKKSIEAYSDSSWSSSIQRTWPNFIMGVSAFWLALIDDVKTTQSSSIFTSTSIPDQLESYRKVDEEITELWQKEGQHSMLHHLSAVFGYKSMLIHW